MINHILSCLLLCAISIPSLGQSATPLLAGQANGARYTDLNPDLDLFADALTAPPNVAARDTELLDLDQDGQPDVCFTASASRGGSLFKSTAVTILNLSSTLQLACYYSDLLKYDVNEPIKESLRTVPGQPSAWRDAASLSSASTAFLGGYAQGGGGTSVSGDFYRDTQGMIAFRLRAGSAWRYGWIQIQTWNLLGNLFTTHFAVQAYALQDFVLGTTPASLAAAQWQLYPAPATEFLMVKAGAGAGRVTILDALGRVASPTYSVPAGQPARLSTAALSAGVYLLQIETSQAAFTKRFYKQ